ncbi:hypothetical protein OG455_41355 [Kitasatospora sp. NBC_01287]|uniref:hypothetical protein n=1 Tax=Kitasatospora sp. NBC_01287 TaxID=2903573 RepID=UPI00225A6E8B|nr:hypothetical protein [Kitasatospora sp. NBC_01287]MCX4750931.1 hypothetical protein [Kitasatospora sp. NBC_01287]MCX4751818.1 hypothetical protein [Kitasatospora sp. NBC_01287]MCX4751890.1 hypothetical protein [Kitasatospora sp. NBC_01287]
MNIATHLIRKGASRIIADREVKRIRAEHDEFVRNAQIGVTYYTIKPYCQYDEQPGRPVHVTYTFTAHGRGIRAGQLITDSGSGSWAIWYQNGPLTTTRLPTAVDHRDADDRAFGGAAAAAQQRVTAAVEAEMRRLYPASVDQLIAA